MRMFTCICLFFGYLVVINAAACGINDFQLIGSASKSGSDKIDDRLVYLIREAAKFSQYKVRLKSGLRVGDVRNHGVGLACDVVLYDGNKQLNNYQNAKDFRAYESFAHIVKAIQQEKFKELEGILRFGGYFGGPKGKYGALDSMHLDLDSCHGMGGGSFANGLTGQQKRYFPNAGSKGMGTLTGLNYLYGICMKQQVDEIWKTLPYLQPEANNQPRMGDGCKGSTKTKTFTGICVPKKQCSSRGSQQSSVCVNSVVTCCERSACGKKATGTIYDPKSREQCKFYCNGQFSQLNQQTECWKGCINTCNNNGDCVSDDCLVGCGYMMASLYFNDPEESKGRVETDWVPACYDDCALFDDYDEVLVNPSASSSCQNMCSTIYTKMKEAPSNFICSDYISEKSFLYNEPNIVKSGRYFGCAWMTTWFNLKAMSRG